MASSNSVFLPHVSGMNSCMDSCADSHMDSMPMLTAACPSASHFHVQYMKPEPGEILMFVCSLMAKSRQILMFVCLQKDAKECCDATKLNRTHC